MLALAPRTILTVGMLLMICAHTVSSLLCLRSVSQGHRHQLSILATHSKDKDIVVLPQWMIQWRGEASQGSSQSLRQWEFTSAFLAELADKFPELTGQTPRPFLDNLSFHFLDALDNSEMSNGFDSVKVDKSAMQYVLVTPSSQSGQTHLTEAVFRNSTQFHLIFTATIRRCSLIRRGFHIVATGKTYTQLAETALENRSFQDLGEAGSNQNATWSLRLRQYHSKSTAEKKLTNESDWRRLPRYGKKVRSPLTEERKAIISMSALIATFRGKVDLVHPECEIYLLDGLKQHSLCPSDDNLVVDNLCRNIENDTKCGEMYQMLLARVVANGPKTSLLSPKKRICITTTPLSPIASFSLCNIAQLSRQTNTTILDPFAGSCSTLLAAAFITGRCQSVAIEISFDKCVNRQHIQQDFDTRALCPPLRMIQGDCMSYQVRQQARWAIGGGGFDVIVTDPPYGIRESMGWTTRQSTHDDDQSQNLTLPPLTRFFHAMGQDRSKGQPLLKLGGRLVAFLPVFKGESLEDCLPDEKSQEKAGLVREGVGKEQVLNDRLSRWLVSFVCVKG